jgi:hypothetical protein
MVSQLVFRQHTHTHTRTHTDDLVVHDLVVDLDFALCTSLTLHEKSENQN